MAPLQHILADATGPEGCLTPLPHALLLFAHPDDEVIGLGARLGRFGAAHFAHVTDGAPADERDSCAHGFSTLKAYREARSAEFAGALRLAGIPGASTQCFDFPDGQAAFDLCELTDRIGTLLHQLRPAVVFTHSYEGGHPDHDACAFAVQHACAALGERAPLVIEAAGYHAHPAGSDHGFVCNTFLPGDTPRKDYVLTPSERTRKAALLAAFATQWGTLRYFNTEGESFRIAPHHHFTQPPHAGPAWYDRYGWQITSARFCALARRASETLQAGVTTA